MGSYQAGVSSMPFISASGWAGAGALSTTGWAPPPPPPSDSAPAPASVSAPGISFSSVLGL